MRVGATESGLTKHTEFTTKLLPLDVMADILDFGSSRIGSNPIGAATGDS